MKKIINNKEVEFSFGLYFLGKAQKEFNTDLKGLLENIIKNPLSEVADLMYYSIKCNCEIDEVELPITKREFISFLELGGEYGKKDGIIKQWTDKLLVTIKGTFEMEDEGNEGVDKKKI